MRKGTLFFLCALLFASAGTLPAAETDKDPEIKVEGTGLLQNLRFNRLLADYSADELKQTGAFSAATVEDGLILIRSRLRRDGYLEPTFTVVLATRTGEAFELEVTGNKLLELSRDYEYRSVTYKVERGVQFYYDELDFSGLESLDAAFATRFFFPPNNLIGLQRFRPYSPDSVKAGVGNLTAAYANLGYRDAKVAVARETVEPSTGAASVEIQVSEGPIYRVIRLSERLTGSEDPEAASLVGPDRELEADLTPDWRRETLLGIRVRYFEAGYPDVKVALETRPAGNGDAGTFPVEAIAQISPGPRVRTGEIRFSGLEHTRERTVERQLEVESGAWLSRNDLENSRRHIGDLGVFTSVRSEMGEGTTGDDGIEVRDIRFDLEEVRRREMFLRGGWGSYEQLRLGLELIQNNIFGRAHRSRLFLGYSLKSENLDWSYTVPELWVSGLRWNASIDWLNREEVSFEREEWAFETGFDTFLDALDTRARINYNLERLESRQVDRTQIPGDDRTRNSSVEFTLIHDQRNNPIVPKDGYRVRLNGEFAAEFLGSEVNFQRYELDFAWHKDFQNGWMVHTGLRHGYVFSVDNPDRVVPFNKRFFPGGQNSIRGYQEGEASFRNANGLFLGSASFLLGNFEIERVLFGELSAVAFYDGLFHAERENDYPGSEYLSSVGVGLRYNTILGPVRLEYGYNLDRREGDPVGTLHFSLGTPF